MLGPPAGRAEEGRAPPAPLLNRLRILACSSCWLGLALGWGAEGGGRPPWLCSSRFVLQHSEAQKQGHLQQSCELFSDLAGERQKVCLRFHQLFCFVLFCFVLV